AIDSLDEDDLNTLLTIQLSLQECELALDSEPQHVLSNETSLESIGSSLSSRSEPLVHPVDCPCSSLSSSGLLELDDSFMRLGTITSQYAPTDIDSNTDAPGLVAFANANLLGNIMAWHDMNPQCCVDPICVCRYQPLCTPPSLMSSAPHKTNCDLQPADPAVEREEQEDLV
ncbi:hypothetical protein P4O66_019482, partial [Electrophorus voltai]